MLPLKGVKVISVEQYGAGPLGSLHLADFGAEVIRVEDPATNGDASRYMAAPFAHVAVEADSLFYQCINRNKKSITINLSHRKGREIFAGLVKNADVVFNNLRGDLPDKMGLTYEKLKNINPRIVCCTLSAWGREGEWTKFPGYDYLIQGVCGLMSVTGEPDGPPVRSGIPIVDATTAIAAAFAIAAGLLQAQETGHGADLDTSLFQTELAQLSHLAVWNLYGNHVPERVADSGYSQMAPAQNFPTEDGWIAVMASTEQEWENLCLAIGQESMIQDERFKTAESRCTNKGELIEIICAVMKKKATAYWVARLREFKVPVSRINSINKALQESEVHRHIVEINHEDFGIIRESKSSASCVEGSIPLKRAPKLGEHTREILKSLNYTENEITALMSEGVI